MNDGTHPPGNPPSDPPPTGPRPNDPTHPGREVSLIRGEHRIALTSGGRQVAAAIRTAFGWHIPRGRNSRGERVWDTADTAGDAISRLYAIAAGAA